MSPSGSTLEAANGTPQHGSGDVVMPPAQPDDLTKPFLEYMRGAGGSIDHRCAAALQWVLHHEDVDPKSVSAQMLSMMQNIRSGWTKTKDLEVEIEKSKIQLEHVKNAKMLKLKALGENGSLSQVKILDEWEASKTTAIQAFISEKDKESTSVSHEAELQLEELVNHVEVLLHPEQFPLEDSQKSPEVDDLVKELDTLFLEENKEPGTGEHGATRCVHDTSGVMATKPPHIVAIEHISALPDGQTKTALMALCELNMVSPSQDIGGYSCVESRNFKI